MSKFILAPGAKKYSFGPEWLIFHTFPIVILMQCQKDKPVKYKTLMLMVFILSRAFRYSPLLICSSLSGSGGMSDFEFVRPILLAHTVLYESWRTRCRIWEEIVWHVDSLTNMTENSVFLTEAIYQKLVSTVKSLW